MNPSLNGMMVGVSTVTTDAEEAIIVVLIDFNNVIADMGDRSLFLHFRAAGLFPKFDNQVDI